jgi:hypothetical protein
MGVKEKAIILHSKPRFQLFVAKKAPFTAFQNRPIEPNPKFADR